MVTTLTEKVYVPVKEHPDVSYALYFLYLTVYLIGIAYLAYANLC